MTCVRPSCSSATDHRQLKANSCLMAAQTGPAGCCASPCVACVSHYNACVCTRYDHRGKEIACGGASHGCVTLFNCKFLFILPGAYNSGTSNEGEYTGLILGLQAACVPPAPLHQISFVAMHPLSLRNNLFWIQYQMDDEAACRSRRL